MTRPPVFVATADQFGGGKRDSRGFDSAQGLRARIIAILIIVGRIAGAHLTVPRGARASNAGRRI